MPGCTDGLSALKQASEEALNYFKALLLQKKKKKKKN